MTTILQASATPTWVSPAGLFAKENCPAEEANSYVVYVVNSESKERFKILGVRFKENADFIAANLNEAFNSLEQF